MAPTGQCAEHWPHLMQGDSASVTPAAGAMRVFSPRPMNSSAQMPCMFWQTEAQRPQRMHFSGLRTMEGVDSSRGRSRRRLP